MSERISFDLYQQVDDKEVFERKGNNFKLNPDHIVFEHDMEIPIKSAIIGGKKVESVKLVMLITGNIIFGNFLPEGKFTEENT